MLLTIPAAFQDLEDPRREHTTRLHPLENLIVMALCGVICGADSWVEIELFGNSKKAWLANYLDMSHGVPSHDTFGRVFARLDPVAFQRALVAWTSAIFQHTDGQVIAIDGKKVRRSYDRASGKSAIHMVGAWATENHVALGQVKVDDKSNEITAIPELLKMLALKGCIVTIDAMGCQKSIAKKIVEQDADYVLALKDNHPIFYAEVIDLIDFAMANRGTEDLVKLKDTDPAQASVVQRFDIDTSLLPDTDATVSAGSEIPQQSTTIRLSTVVEIGKGHGRRESRRVWSLGGVGELLGHFGWPGLSSVMAIESRRIIDDEVSTHWRYYISSLDGHCPRRLGGAVRAHWGIENGLHWVLDMAFREDECRVRSGHAAENLAHLRRAAMSQLKRTTRTKVGVKARRLKAALDERYLLEVLGA